MVLREIEAAVRRLGLGGRSLLLAVSGGVDSTVLVHVLQRLSRRHGLDLSIGHVNHSLRGEESDADARFVRALGAGLGIPVAVVAVDPLALREGRSSRDRPTLQEAARELRYGALERLAAGFGAGHVVTAHQADDQAETVLGRLLRGSGPDGLRGIPVRSPDGRIVRPLLRVPRAEIEAFAREQGISWREDPSNASHAYTRNRIRALLPRLAADFNPRLLKAIGDLAEAQARDSEWIEDLVAREAIARIAPDPERNDTLMIDAKDWSALPEALALRLAREALRRAGAGRHSERVHLERMAAFLGDARPGSGIEVPGGLELTREPGPEPLYRLGAQRVRPGAAC